MSSARLDDLRMFARYVRAKSADHTLTMSEFRRANGFKHGSDFENLVARLEEHYDSALLKRTGMPAPKRPNAQGKLDLVQSLQSDEDELVEDGWEPPEDILRLKRTSEPTSLALYLANIDEMMRLQLELASENSGNAYDDLLEMQRQLLEHMRSFAAKFLTDCHRSYFSELVEEEREMAPRRPPQPRSSMTRPNFHVTKRS